VNHDVLEIDDYLPIARVLQLGHVFLKMSHLCTHIWWKMCWPEHASTIMLYSFLNVSKQILHVFWLLNW